MLKAIVIDDEQYAREELITLLAEQDEVEIEVIASCSNAIEGLKKVNQLKPDLIFLDIQMPQISGIEMLAMLDIETMPKVIFVTAFDDYALQLIQRVNLAKKIMPNIDWPDFTKEGLAVTLRSWLLPYLAGTYTWQDLVKQNFTEMLSSMMDWMTLNTLKQIMPERYKVPSGSNIQLNYLSNGQVKMSVRMQEIYGLADTPSVGNGKIHLHLELLSPAGRPLQTTQDLAGFWKGSYKAIQKEMKGRYQNHFWPDDPANAPATTRTKKKMHDLPE